MARFRRTRRAARRAVSAARGAITRIVSAPARAVKPVIVRVGGGASRGYRRFRGGITARNKQFSIKQVVAEAAVASLGGGTSAIYDAVTDATANKMDDNAYARPVVKSIISGGIKWLFGGNRYAKVFADGWQGDTAGHSLRSIGQAAAGK